MESEFQSFSTEYAKHTLRVPGSNRNTSPDESSVSDGIRDDESVVYDILLGSQAHIDAHCAITMSAPIRTKHLRRDDAVTYLPAMCSNL